MQIRSKVNTRSDTYELNFNHNKGLADDLSNLQSNIALGGNERSRSRHVSRGKLLPRDRVKKLLDPDSQFLEFSSLAAHQVYDDEVPAASLITGIGYIHEQPCVVVCNDATVKGGTYYPLTVKKHLRAQEIALENKLPCIYLVDSGGAFLPLQSEVFPDKQHFGRIFYNQANLSAEGMPQIAVVMGSCTAGGAYVPAMCDQAIIVKGQGTIFLGGPPLVKAATGEEVDAESLGGGEVHTKVSGVADYLANDDEHALAIARDIIADCAIQRTPTTEVGHSKDPLYPAEEMYGVVSSDTRTPYNVKEIIARLVDDSEFSDFKPLYGDTLVCGFAQIWGYPVAILANNGILFSESALKAAHFIQLADRRGIPLLFLQNISGFMVGQKYENEGIAKDGAKMVTAVACAKVPKLTVVIGGSFGAGNYAMCGRAYGARFLWTWPNARISVMGGEQAARVLATVQRDAAVSRDQEIDDDAENAFMSEIRDQYETEGHPYFASARLWDDGILDPVDTRATLGMALYVVTQPMQAPNSRFGVFRM